MAFDPPMEDRFHLLPVLNCRARRALGWARPPEPLDEVYGMPIVWGDDLPFMDNYTWCCYVIMRKAKSKRIPKVKVHVKNKWDHQKGRMWLDIPVGYAHLEILILINHELETRPHLGGGRARWIACGGHMLSPIGPMTPDGFETQRGFVKCPECDITWWW